MNQIEEVRIQTRAAQLLEREAEVAVRSFVIGCHA